MKLNKTEKVDLIFAFVENFVGAIRTASALLLGNSILVYFNIIGSGNGKNFDKLVVIGIVLAILSAIPLNNIRKLYQEKKNG